MKLKKVNVENDVLEITRDELTHVLATVTANLSEMLDEPGLVLFGAMFSSEIVTELFKKGEEN